MKKFLILCILISLIIAGFFLIFRPQTVANQKKEQPDILTVPIRSLKNQSFTYTKNFIGSVEAVHSVAIVPYISAFLKKVLVQSGQEVKKGETLFLLEDKIQLAELNQAKEAVQQAKAKQENTKTYYERIQKTDQKAISKTELEQAKTEYEAAQANYQKAIAAQNQAQTLYNYSIIQAPISGWVGDIRATVGEYLSPESKPLATIIGFSPVRLFFSVPLRSYQGNNLENNHPILQVILSDEQVLEFKNFKIARNNQADKKTDSVSFFIDLQNEEKLLIPGAYVDISFLYQEKGILVDKNQITLTPDGAEATLLKNKIITKQKVEIGAPIGHKYWIKSGLNESDELITIPVSPFQIGQPAKGIQQ